MEQLLIGFTDRAKGAVIREIVAKGGFTDAESCSSGEEILRYAGRYGGGLVICGYKVGNMVYSEIREMLLPQFGMLVLLSRTQAAWVEEEAGLFFLVLPVQKPDLLRTVHVVLELGRKNGDMVLSPGKTERQIEDKLLIERAKLLLMNRYQVSEEDAHRFLQRRSMNRGMKMVQTAQEILKEGGQDG